MNANDRERIVKSAQTANLLVQDLREMVKASSHCCPTSPPTS